MIGICLLVCVLALLVLGLLACIAWDACGYDKRIIALETKVADLYVKLAELYRHVARDECGHDEQIIPLESTVRQLEAAAKVRDAQIADLCLNLAELCRHVEEINEEIAR